MNQFLIWYSLKMSIALYAFIATNLVSPGSQCSCKLLFPSYIKRTKHFQIGDQPWSWWKVGTRLTSTGASGKWAMDSSKRVTVSSPLHQTCQDQPPTKTHRGRQSPSPRPWHWSTVYAPVTISLREHAKILPWTQPVNDMLDWSVIMVDREGIY